MRRGWKRRCKRSINPSRLQSRLWQKRKRAIRLRATTIAIAQDKAVFAHHIQSEIVLDIIKANAAEIKAMMEGVDDGTD